MTVTVTINKKKLKALEGLTSQRSPEMVAFKKGAAKDYRAFLFDRFNRFSRGGGNWKKTQRWKRNKPRRGGQFKVAGGGKRFHLILRDTNTLMNALTPEFSRKPGQYQKLSGNSIIIGIKGGKHPKFKGSVGKLAAIHNYGKGRMPKRQIFVMASQELQQQWAAQLKALPKRNWRTGQLK
jgi:hypothetical protein